MAFAVQTGMLTSLCAIASLIAVCHCCFQTRSVSDFDNYRYTSHLTLSSTSPFILYWGDVRPNRSSYAGLRLFPFSVYCNSLLATLNVRNTLRNKSRCPSLNPTPDPNTPTLSNHNMSRSFGLGPRSRDTSPTPERRGLWVSTDLVHTGIHRSASQHTPPTLELPKLSPGLDLEDPCDDRKAPFWTQFTYKSL